MYPISGPLDGFPLFIKICENFISNLFSFNGNPVAHIKALATPLQLLTVVNQSLLLAVEVFLTTLTQELFTFPLIGVSGLLELILKPGELCCETLDTSLVLALHGRGQLPNLQAHLLQLKWMMKL